MFEVKRALKATVKDLDLGDGRTLSAISSSWQQSRMEAPPLPAVVLDLSGINPDPDATLDDGTVLAEIHQIPVSIFVPIKDRTDEEADEDLEFVTDAVMDAIATIYPQHTMANWYSVNVPWGKVGDVLCGAFMLTISNPITE